MFSLPTSSITQSYGSLNILNLKCGNHSTTTHETILRMASLLTHRYQAGITSEDRRSGFMATAIFHRILAQPRCAGVLAQYAAEDDGPTTIVVSGLDETGRLIEKGILGEDILPCPPFCPAPNVLNAELDPCVQVRSKRAPVFTGRENHLITLAEACRLRSNFVRMNPTTRFTGFSFETAGIRPILCQEDCVGIRMYFARQRSGSLTLVIVGAKPNGDDLLHGPVLIGRPFVHEILSN